MKAVGILLAAGRGRRFDASGAADKLMQPLYYGEPVARAAAQHLLAVVPDVLAVVRPGADALAAMLTEAGCRVSVCAAADQGMGASLAHAIQESRTADGWLVALADMPHVHPATMLALLEALRAGAGIAAPVFEGQRGNPVAFSEQYRDVLLGLSGDVGAREILQANPVTFINVNDRGILRDIDTPADLA